MPGEEHPRLAALWPLHQRDKGFEITPDLYTKTPQETANQYALRVACMLLISIFRPDLVSPAAAQSAAIQHFKDQKTHQAIGEGFDSNEQKPGDPHGGDLWGSANAAILWAAWTQKITAVLESSMRWWGDDLAIEASFMTPSGLRIPCARALSLPPSFVGDSRIYALIMEGHDGHSAAAQYGNVAPPAADAFNILRACAPTFANLRKMAQVARPKLGTPIRKWQLPGGGFLAAFTVDSRQIDQPCGWIEVQASGKYVEYGRLLGEMPAAAIPKSAPEIIGA